MHVRFRTRGGKHIGVVDRGARRITVEAFTARSGMEGRILLDLSLLDALTLAELLTKEAAAQQETHP